MKQVFYLSGKISGLTRREYIHNFKRSEIELKRRSDIIFTHYDLIINPLNIKPIFGIKNWWCYMIADLWKLRKCTHIAMQPNWIDSKGAVIEYFYAKFILKLKVIWL